jgi:formiminotetrahydrofolate cyclodeaminase
MASRLFPSSESQVVRSSPASAGGGSALDLSLLSSSLTTIAGQLTDIQAKLSRQDDAMQRQQAEIEELKKLSFKK